MKRMWIGAALLLVLLGLGIFATVASGSLHSEIAGILDTAAQAAKEENWEEAERAFRLANARWQRRHHIVAAVTDHEPMEEIDSLFAQLKPYLQERESLSFCSGCHALAVLVRAVGEAHAVNWWNLL